MRLILDELCSELTALLSSPAAPRSSEQFEQAVRASLSSLLHSHGILIDLSAQAQQFPDVILEAYGIEVKFTQNDTWRSVANSVSEGTRHATVEDIYVVYGKAGGTPEVRWRRYEDCVIHVRTSHRPRFELDMTAGSSLFDQIGVSYQDFQRLDIHGRMEHIRKYARARLRPGERLWWMDADSEEDHTLPVQARLYMSLDQEEKRKLRAEAALLCPQVVKPSRSKGKYDDVALYLLTYRGVLASQVRDLFTAGSVAMRADSARGGNYMLRALQDIQAEIRAAAEYLEDDLFEEYWGFVPPKADRIREWLRQADEHARDWRPSEHLFQD